jgi:hypothetical protein
MASGGKTVEDLDVALAANHFHVLDAIRSSRDVKIRALFALRAANRMMAGLESARVAVLFRSWQPLLNGDKLPATVNKYEWNLVNARALAMRAMRLFELLRFLLED